MYRRGLDRQGFSPSPAERETPLRIYLFFVLASSAFPPMLIFSGRHSCLLCSSANCAEALGWNSQICRQTVIHADFFNVVCHLARDSPLKRFHKSPSWVDHKWVTDRCANEYVVIEHTFGGIPPQTQPLPSSVPETKKKGVYAPVLNLHLLFSSAKGSLTPDPWENQARVFSHL